MEREKIVNFFTDGEDRQVAARILDLAELAAKTVQHKSSGFLDPHGREVAMSVLANIPDVRGFSYGGYSNAERHKVFIVPVVYAVRPELDIAAVSISGNFQFQKVTHRDYLGAVLALGLKRDVIGDIIVQDDGSCQMIVDATVQDFICSELVQIHRVGVNTKTIDLDQIVVGEQRVKDIRATAASLRLDIIAAAGFSMSRSRMADEIKADRVKINWKAVKSASQEVKPGDVLSMRGRGRVEFVEAGGITKKGRYTIILRRYY